MLPHIDRNSPTPIYQQIQAWIRDQIVSEAWPEHHQLQAEDDLAIELGVNRGTLRNAIKALIDEGYLIRIHGKGTFVARRVVDQSLAQHLSTFSEGLMSANIAYTTIVLDQELRTPDEEVASLLDVSDDETVFCLQRVRVVKDSPVILIHNYVSTHHCPGIEQYNFEDRRLFDVMERDYKLRLAWGRRTFEAHAANPDVANALRIMIGAPVMYVRQITYSAQNIPLEFSEMWIDGGNFRMSAVVSRGQGIGQLNDMPAFLQTELTL